MYVKTNSKTAVGWKPSVSVFTQTLISNLLCFTLVLPLITYKVLPITGLALLTIALFIVLNLTIDWFIAKSYRPPRGTFVSSLSRITLPVYPLKYTIVFALTTAFYVFAPEYHKAYYREFISLYWIFLFFVAIPLLITLTVKHFLKRNGFRLKIFAFLDGLVFSRKEIALILIKVFFIPLMFSSLCRMLVYFQNYRLDQLVDHEVMIIPLLITLFFSFDILGAITGYIFSLKIFNTEVKSAESSIFAWIVTIICYEPFNNFVFPFFDTTRIDTEAWLHILSNNSVLIWFYGTTLSFLVFLYCAGTISFGLRFSNLTNRGIISTFPYNLFQHPAYISKNLFWWCSSIPVIILSPFHKQVQIISTLLILSLVYFLRAKTEERHLMHDPEYQDYDRWIKKRDPFSVYRWFHSLKRSH